VEGLSAASLAGNDPAAWFGAALAFLVVTAAVMALRSAVPRWAAAWASRTSNGLDDLVAAVLSRTQATFALAMGLLAALAILALPPEAEEVLRRVVVALVVVQIGGWGTGLVRGGIERYADRADPLVGNATGVLRVVGVGVVWAITALLLLANLGVDVTAGIAGLGVGGIALALALQNVLSDLFASLSIVLDRPFAIGDFVVVDGYMGTVEHIGLKTTRIRSLSGEQLVFGNGDLLASRIRNYKDLRERRVVFTFGVGYGTPPAVLRRIPELVAETVAGIPGARLDRAHLFRFADSSLDFEVVWFFEGADYNPYMDAQQALWLGLLERLSALGVEIPFPQRTVWLQHAPHGAPNAELVTVEGA
jgi:small-conductance mechanosensitive channel